MINTGKLTNATFAQYERLDSINRYFLENQVWLIILFGVLTGITLFCMIVGVVALVIIAIKLNTVHAQVNPFHQLSGAQSIAMKHKKRPKANLKVADY